MIKTLTCKTCNKEYKGHHASKWCPVCKGTEPETPYSVVEGLLCKRRCVAYDGDRFPSRPEPFDPHDIPDDDSRCQYKGEFPYRINPDGVQIPK